MLFIMHQASVWLNAVDSDYGINIMMAQCCASGINMAVHHHASIWLDAVHPQFNDVHQASMWLKPVHHVSIWLNMAQCCTGINLWTDAMHQANMAQIFI